MATLLGAIKKSTNSNTNKMKKSVEIIIRELGNLENIDDFKYGGYFDFFKFRELQKDMNTALKTLNKKK
jgi:hypothetical protein